MFCLLALAPAAAGCGSATRRREPPGARLFAANCSSCHSLTGHNYPSKQGGDLLHLRIPQATLAQFTAEMPVPHRLSAAQVRLIDDYLIAVTGAGRGR